MSNLPPSAKGGMSPAGTTTVVGLNKPKIDGMDKKVLCSAMCYCDMAPNIGKGGIQLKQACVAERIKAVDKLLSHRSPYKQEISYDMTKVPPSPIMDRLVDTKSHGFIPGWIRKYWEDEHGSGYQAGFGLIRRPDVVIVLDPTKPPTQDNIKQIVEMKFPPDTISSRQRLAYEKIAGDENKLKTLEPSECDCHASEPDAPKIPVEAAGWAAVIAGWLAYIAARGKSPRPPYPVPGLNPGLVPQF